MSVTIHLSSLDIHFADFINRIDKNPCDQLWLAAALASSSSGSGHTCFDMSAAAGWSVDNPGDLPAKLTLPDYQSWKASLSSCDTVGSEGEYTPLVLDQAGRLYLHRSWEYESRVAESILSRTRAPEIESEKLNRVLDHFFPATGEQPDLQRQAAGMALTRDFAVISGGPGTGKTATVARILASVIELAGDKQPKIALAAPTGKAAMRLRVSIMSAAEKLGLSDELRNRLAGQVSTIHRLLGVRPGGGFHHNRDNPLHSDLLVVDEASMVDLPLMSRLLEALHGKARVILLGDRDQLASVEAGAVLADICSGASGTAESGSPVIQLTRSYRFDGNSGIGALSRLINAGEDRAALDLICTGDFPDIIWRQLPAGSSFEAVFRCEVKSGFEPYLDAAGPDNALAELDRYRVLSPLRSGLYGTANLNRLCESALGLKSSERGGCYHQMPLMVSGNNYELGLFNGDTGVVSDKDGRQVCWFSDPESGLRPVSLLRMPAHETAFALTVHKSQGSEFDKVLLILPDRMSEALSRELLYTAITRARSRVEIWGCEEVFRQTVMKRTERRSGLRDKLAGMGSLHTSAC